MASTQLNDRSDTILWAAIIVFAVSIIFSTAIVNIMVGVLVVLWLAKMWTSRPYRFTRTVLDLPFVAFLLARVASVLFSTDMQRSLPTLWVEIFFYVVFFVLTNEFDILNPKRVRILMKSLFIAAAVAAVIGGTKYLLGMVERASSTTAGYYTLGGFLLPILTIALCAGRTKNFFPNRALWAAVCLVLATGILFTFNRLHWAAMTAVFVVVGAMKERLLLAVFVVFAVGFVVFSPSGAQRFSDLLNVVSRSSDRDVIWKGASLLAGEHPVFGFGPRTFDAIFPLKAELADKGVGSWHNDYVQVYMESGAIGVLSLLWLLGATVFYGIAALRNPELPSTLRDLLIGLLAAIVVMAIVGGMLDTLISFLFRIFLALVALIATTYALVGKSSGIRASRGMP